MTMYVDTSALLRRYLRDRHSRVVSGAIAAWMPRWWASNAAQRARLRALVFALPGATNSKALVLRKTFSRKR